MRNLKIGIVSMTEHVKSHVKLLERAGHKIVLLGPKPKLIPESLDLLIYRPTGVSHKAADRLRSDNPKQPVIFSDSLSEIVEQVERFSLTGSLTVPAPTQKEIPAMATAQPTTTDPTPIKGASVSAYFKSRENRWDIRSGSSRNVYVGRAKTREEALAWVARLDAENAQKAATVVDTEPVVDVESVAEPMVEPVIEIPSVLAQPVEVTEDRKQQDELNAILQMLAEQLNKMQLEEYNDLDATGLGIKVYARHLNGPEGLACGQSLKGPMAGSLATVTCKPCRNSKLFKTVEWVFTAGLTA